MKNKARMLLGMAAVMAAQYPHLPVASYNSQFKPYVPARRNTPEIEAWNRAVERRKAEKRARKGGAA